MRKKQRKRKAIKQGLPLVSPEVLLRRLGDVVKTPPEQFYIKRPPGNLFMTQFPKRVPNLYIPALDKDIFELAAHLRAIQKEYRRTGNGIYLISAFLLTYEAKLFPRFGFLMPWLRPSNSTGTRRKTSLWKPCFS